MRRREREKIGRTGNPTAAASASHLAQIAPQMLDRAVGVAWYDRPGSDVDLAAYMLCRLRRARAGERGGLGHGDEAVRGALLEAEHEALVWFASRAVSFMDEAGFPESVERWFGEGGEA